MREGVWGGAPVLSPQLVRAAPCSEGRVHQRQLSTYGAPCQSDWTSASSGDSYGPPTPRCPTPRQAAQLQTPENCAHTHGTASFLEPLHSRREKRATHRSCVPRPPHRLLLQTRDPLDSLTGQRTTRQRLNKRHRPIFRRRFPLPGKLLVVAAVVAWSRLLSAHLCCGWGT